MRMKKFTALCLAGAMALSLAACGSDSGSGKSAQSQEADTQAVTEAAQSESAQESAGAGTETQASGGESVDVTDIGYDHLIIGVDDTFAPMGFLDENNELVGFDIDLARAAGERLGVDVEFQVINWDMKEQELNQGNVDLIWNGYSITDERREQVNFTDPYLDNEQVVVTMADSGITSLEDLAGKVVAAQINSSAVEAMDAHPEISDTFADRPVFDTNDMAIMDLSLIHI